MGKAVEVQRLGRLEISVLSDGIFRLDGGGIFGILPRTRWSKMCVPDEHNRIALGMNCLLVNSAGGKILIDAGLGRRLGEKELRYFCVSPGDPGLVEALASTGTRPGEIKAVVLTHFHLDHCGGCTILEKGRTSPAFPKARIFAQKKEWQAFEERNDLNRRSYLEENVLPLGDSGQLELLDGDTEILDGVRVEVLGGHSPGHQCVFLESEGQKAVFCGDLIPTSHHLPPTAVMAYDIAPHQTMEAKKRFLDRVVQERIRLFFSHDAYVSSGLVRYSENGSPILERIQA